MAATLNPPIPYQAALLNGPARVGSWIEVRGSIPDDSDTFAVNLKNAADDIALHFNPRFGANDVVLNSAVGGCWGGEEHSALHCHCGGTFCLTLVIEPDGISTTLNGYHACFNHRMPLEDICQIEVRGSVVVDAIREGAAVDKNKPLTDLHVPAIVHIPNGLTRGNKLILKATPHGEFSFNLQKDCAFDMKDIALHINPRFGNNTVVLNTTVDGNWGGEEVVHGNPLVLGAPFLLEIATKIRAFKISVNGETLAKYNHRSPYHDLKEIDTLFVKGAVTLHEVKLGDDD